MKTTLLILATLVALTGCTKQKGCTDAQSLNYNSDAEVNDGSCAYLSGTYLMTEQCDVQDKFNVTIPENGVTFTIQNFAHIFPVVTAYRIRTAIVIDSQTVKDTDNNSWTVSGYGSISADGKTLTLNYTLDGYSCSASGNK